MIDIKSPEEIKKVNDCRMLRIRAQRLRETARILEEIAREMESQYGCNNTLSLGEK